MGAAADVDLRDGLLEEARAAGRPLARFWEPERPVVVLGRADQAATACDEEACRALGVPVVKRRGGGGTVLLAPGVLVLSLAGPAGLVPRPARVFAHLNGWIRERLRELAVEGLREAGLSDLALGERKVLGCSLAFSRGFYLYQGSLLVHPDLDLVSRTLSHPAREPDYRRGRSHADFLTTLAGAGHDLSVRALARHFRERFDDAPPAPLA